MADETKLNLGCGRDLREGWVNLDHPLLVEEMAARGVVGPIGYDIDQPEPHLPFDDDSFDMVEASHVLEHLHNLLPVVQEVWRVLRPGGQFMVAVPYGSSDDADEDPTHIRRFFPGSWSYFSQPTYWRADYGYRGDLKPVTCLLFVDALRYPAGDAQQAQVIEDIVTKRNVVDEMRVVFEAIKPARHWTDAGGMDTWETRVIFAARAESSDNARAERVEQEKSGLWTP